MISTGSFAMMGLPLLLICWLLLLVPLPGDVLPDHPGRITCQDNSRLGKSMGHNRASCQHRIFGDGDPLEDTGVSCHPNVVINMDILARVDPFIAGNIQNGVGIPGTDIDIVGEHTIHTNLDPAARFCHGDMHIFECGPITDPEDAVAILEPDLSTPVEAATFPDMDVMIISTDEEADIVQVTAIFNLDPVPVSTHFNCYRQQNGFSQGDAVVRT